jgi:N-acetylneuraminic acid mutarotase
MISLSACQTEDEPEPYEPTHKWAWISGGNTANPAGVYGTLGTPAASNVPGGRESALSWPAPDGSFWLFGGNGYDSAGYKGLLNDLWKFDTVTRQWTWVSGSSLRSQEGVYGTKGVADPANVPGARIGAVSWIDPDGKLWLFGGLGNAEAGDYGQLNDLWTFDPVSVQWTWVSGNSTSGQTGVYGTLGAEDPANVPGARTGHVSWTDTQGRLWLFGGYGFDSAGEKGWLNDLWRYDPDSLAWTWISGGDTQGQAGVYGSRGTAAPANHPGGRGKAASWIDLNGNLWLLGGDGLDSEGMRGDLNDFWKFDPTTLEWTWIYGSNLDGQQGVYGQQDYANELNYPGCRSGAITWVDAAGNLWLFGGLGEDSQGNRGKLNDMWWYNMTTFLWTWASGSNYGGQPGVYGTLGTGETTNVAGARDFAVSWFDPQGKFWLFGGYGLDKDGAGGWLNDLWYMIK